MKRRTRAQIGWLFLSCMALASCGGGGDTDAGIEPPINTDYSNLKLVEPGEGALQAGDDAAVLDLLRNGLRLSLGAATMQLASPVVSATAPQSDAFSDTTVQVDGVDEADLVEYDGRFLYTLVPQVAPPLPMPVVPAPAVGLSLVPGYYWPGYATTLKIARTDATTATTETVGEFKFDGRQAGTPSIYKVAANSGATQFLAAVSQTNWLTYSAFAPQSIVPRPNRVAVELLDVVDPSNVTRAWKFEMEGWLRTSRKIGDTLYLVSSYWPTLIALDNQPQSEAQRQANERLIASASADQLLPRAWQNGAESALLAPRHCLLPSVAPTDAYRELVIVTAVNLVERRVSDVACLSSGENGIYMSRDSLYVGGTQYPFGGAGGARTPTTVLHKFALHDGELDYRATGAVAGTIGWNNSSYFMDEHQGDLRIVTTRYRGSDFTHHLSVLREAGNRLAIIASLPNTAHPEPIGKPREQVRAVRFAGERAYVVTFLTIDPLYVIDLRSATDPVIAGALDVPGFSTYLRPMGANHLLGVGQHTDSMGRPLGVKVELFDVRDIANPRSVGAHIFGRSWSEALFDFHAMSFVTLPGPNARYRMAISLNVFDTPQPSNPSQFTWTHTGLHLFEASGLEGGVPRLHFQGVLKAAEPSATDLWPPYVEPVRSVLHNDAVFYVYGDQIISSLWGNVGGG